VETAEDAWKAHQYARSQQKRRCESADRSLKPSLAHCSKARSLFMQDILWIAVTFAFFAASIAYVHFCDRVK
jgi:hypothetical protein